MNAARGRHIANSMVTGKDKHGDCNTLFLASNLLDFISLFRFAIYSISSSAADPPEVINGAD